MRSTLTRLTPTVARASEQIAWTAVSFVGTSVGAAFLTVAEFGSLAVGASIVLLVQALARAWFADPQALASVEDPSLLPGVRQVAATKSIRILMMVALGGLAPTLIVAGPHQVPLVVGTALSAALVAPSDVNRGALLISGRVMQSLVCAITGLIAEICIAAALLALGLGPGSLLIAWSGAFAVNCTLAPRLMKQTNSVAEQIRSRQAFSAIRRATQVPFTIEAALTAGVSQGSVLLLAASVGTIGSAATRGAFLLFFPINMAIQSAAQSILPQVGPFSRSRAGIRRLVVIAGYVAVGILAYGLIVYVCQPLDAILLGQTLEAAVSIMWGVALYVTGTAVLLIAIAAARTAGQLAYGPIIRATLAPWSLLAPSILGASHGLAGICVAYAGSGTLMLLASGIVLLRLRQLAKP